MTLHLVRLAVDLRALAAFAVANGASDDDGGYALHLALRRRFGAAGPQPFRFLPDHRSGPHLLGYLADRPALEDAAALPAADPLLGGVFAGPPAIQPMPDAWRPGARYGFEVRARPVVRFGARVKAERQASEPARAGENWWARAGEVDAWIAGRFRTDGDGTDRSREEAYGDWLRTRFAGAARIEAVDLRQFQRSRTRRSAHGSPGRAGQGRGRASRGSVEGPDALMAGTLAIADPDAFARLVARGVGRHAAFGFGMLLLSAAGRPGLAGGPGAGTPIGPGVGSGGA